MEKKQEEKKKEMKQEMEEQQEAQRNEMKAQMEEQQAEKENEMQAMKDELEEKQAEQADMLLKLSEGVATMGGNLEEISENIENIHDYSDLMTPRLPSKQPTLDNMT